jgi:hypothetical protein
MRTIFKVLILILLLGLTSFLNADLNEGIIVHYPFNGNASDESGNGNDGTVYGATLTNDRFGNENSAYDFDGLNDYIRKSNTSDFNKSDGQEISIVCWIKPNWISGSGYSIIIANRSIPEWNYNWMLYQHADSGTLSLHGVDQNISNYIPTNDEWTFIVASVSSIGDFNLFVNGNLEVSFSDWMYQTQHPSVLSIGNYGSTEFYCGKIDDIRIYDRLLTESEIEFLYYGMQANFTIAENAYVGEQIQLTDTSLGNPTTWEWDFENDGIYDSTYYSYQDAVYWTYENTNADSVKLRISNDTVTDSLTKAISVAYCPPVAPDNVDVNIISPDALISWTAVDTTECGSAIAPDGYVVKFSENEVDYFFLRFTSDTTHTHLDVADYSPQMFYRVIAIKNYTREQIEYIERLNNSREKVSWSVVKKNLDDLTKTKMEIELR